MAEGPSTSKIPGRVKEERDHEDDDEDGKTFKKQDFFEEAHSHCFKFQFRGEQKKYTIHCDRPRTVLEALKTSDTYNAQEYPDENVLITLSRAEKQVAIATHFPCHLIGNDDLLVIHCKQDKVVEARYEAKSSQTECKYVTFFIDSKGGNDTKSKQLFRNNAVKHCDYLWVCAEKGMTVEEALKTDGRFIDKLGKFTLSDKEDRDCHTEHNQNINNLSGKYFKICLVRGKRVLDTNSQIPEKKTKSTVSDENREAENQQENQQATHDSQHSAEKSEAKTSSDVVKQRGRSVKPDIEEILNELREQFPALKKWMQSRFPGDSFKKALELRKENFSKIQQAFSEVHRVRQLLEQGNSICKVVVENVCEGTGFILFDNFILTNGHLFKKCVVPQGDTFQLTADVWAEFNYENRFDTDSYQVKVKETVLDFNYNESDNESVHELDYAILELDRQTVQKPNKELPPGLLQKCGPVPVNGEACIIGHPAGGVKKMDPTCIIEKEKREEARDSNLETFKGNQVPLCKIFDHIKKQGIENIMQGGDKVDKVVTYNTFMYHGSSGSPVFDTGCKVFGLHTAGFGYGKENYKSVIEFAHPLIFIFKNFVMKLKKSQNDKLLGRVKEEVENNRYLKVPLKEVLESDSDHQPMETA